MPDALVLPLYRRDEWDRWVELFRNSDGSEMSPSFESWEAGHLEDYASHKKRGFEVHRVEIRVDDFVAWIRANKLPLNGAKRADFAIHVLVERMGEHGEL